MILDTENRLRVMIEGGKGWKGEKDFCLVNNNVCT